MMIAGSLAASDISDDEEAGTGTSEDARKMIYAAYVEAADRDAPEHMRSCCCCPYNQFQVRAPIYYYFPDYEVNMAVQSRCKKTPEAQRLRQIEKTYCCFEAPGCCWAATLLAATATPGTLCLLKMIPFGTGCALTTSAMIAVGLAGRPVVRHGTSIRIKRYLGRVAADYAQEQGLPMPGVQIMGASPMRPEQLPLLKDGGPHED